MKYLLVLKIFISLLFFSCVDDHNNEQKYTTLTISNNSNRTIGSCSWNGTNWDMGSEYQIPPGEKVKKMLNMAAVMFTLLLILGSVRLDTEELKN